MARRKGPAPFRFLYPLEEGLKTKIETIAFNIYRASKVEFSELAEAQLKRYEALGW